MLDKTVPYGEIWMCRLPEPIIEQPVLPEGYRFAFYQKGDEEAWGEIETAVLEFKEISQALTYFAKTFAPHEDEVKKRMLFVISLTGEKVATCTAWWKTLADGRSFQLFHWLSVLPDHQGKGIAKALVYRTLQLFHSLDEEQPVYLHTQTWSHPAIRLYQKAGFELMKENLDGSKNSDYDKVRKVLTQ